ncbi:MAG: helix-turn-helix domain-containing protein [Patescibacteria group bacterium]
MKQAYRQRTTYAKIWWAVIGYFGLTPTQALLMILIDYLSKKKGFCFSGKELMARVLNVSRATIHKDIKILIAKKLLRYSWVAGYKAKATQPTDQWKKFIKDLEVGRFEGKDFVDELERS